MSLPEISIGDFASQLIKEEISTIKTSKAFTSSDKVDKNQIDISNVELSDIDTNQIILESFGVKTKPSKPKKTKLREEKRKLKEEFAATLAKLKQLIESMTSVGMIGVNMAGPQKSKAKKKNKKKSVY